MPNRAPMHGATMYSQVVSRFPETIAGASERTGFMDAPQTGPANMASSPTVPPMAMAAVIPFSLDPVETLNMTITRMAVRINSITNDCIKLPEGIVFPIVR